MVLKIYSYFLKLSLARKSCDLSKQEITSIVFITFYYLQINKYIFLEDEFKILQNQETKYLQQILNYSAIAPLIFEDDKTVFLSYFITLILLLFYIITIMVEFNSQTYPPFMYQFLLLFNYILFCPIQEIYSTVLYCTITEQTSYCQQNYILNYIVISIGMLLIIIISLISLSFIRRLQLKQNQLEQHFSKLNYIIQGLTLSIIMLFNFSKNNQEILIICHSLHFCIMILQLLQSLQFQHGISTGSYLKFVLSIMSIAFNVIICVWKFQNVDDKFIFITLFLIEILVFYVCTQIYSIYQELTIKYFTYNFSTIYVSDVLEYLINLKIQSFQLIYYIIIHQTYCQDIKCLCQGKNIFTLQSICEEQAILVKKKGYSIQNFCLRDWISQTYMKLILNKKQNKSSIEKLLVNYVSFQKIYIQNLILTCKTVYQTAQFFISEYLNKENWNTNNITLLALEIIQSNCKQQLYNITNSIIKLNQQEFIIISDINIIYDLQQEILLKLTNIISKQIELWNNLNKYIIKDFDMLLIQMSKIQIAKQQCKKLSNLYNKYRRKFQSTIYSMRIELLFNLALQNDYGQILKIQEKLAKLEEAQQYELNSDDYNNLSFLTGQALSLVSNISTVNQGKFEQKITQEFREFFGYTDDKIKLFHVSQVLPSELSQIHDGLVEHFFLKGQSQRFNNKSLTFTLNSQNLIEQVNLCLSYFFPINLKDLQFFIIAHIQKTTTHNMKGYVLADKDFKLFGMTKCIYERLNYKFFSSKNQIKHQIKPEHYYQTCNIFQLIPKIQEHLQHYYEKNNRNEIESDTICIKERGLMRTELTNQDSDYTITQQIKSKLTIPRLTNKRMLSQILDMSLEIENYLQSTQDQQKIYPIEFSIQSHILRPIDSEQQVQTVLYYIIEIEFLEDSKYFTKNDAEAKIKRTQTQTPEKYEVQKQEEQKQEVQKEQIFNYQFNDIQVVSSDRLISPQGDKTSLVQKKSPFQIIKMNTTKTKTVVTKNLNQIDKEFTNQKNQLQNISLQVLKFTQFLEDCKYPKIFITYLSLFFSSLILVIAYTALVCTIFSSKKNIQSNCISYSTEDINFFTNYSSIQSGSRHSIYYSNYQTILNDTILILNQNMINLTKQILINISWNLLIEGEISIINGYNSYVQTSLLYDIKEIQFYYPDYSNTIIQQQYLDSYYTYYQTSYQTILYTFTNLLSLKLYQNDLLNTNQLQRNRIILYYNYDTLQNFTNQTIQSCYEYNLSANNQYDNVASIAFYLLYVFAFLSFIFHFFHLFKIRKLIKLFLKQFSALNQQDHLEIMKLYQIKLENIQQENLLLNYNQFDSIKKNINEQLQTLSKQTTDEDQSINQNIKAKTIKQSIKLTHKISIIKEIIASIIVVLFACSFGITFQLYYNYISSGIAPVANRALLAQQYKLSFITTVNYWDQLIIKMFYQNTMKLNNSNSIFNYTSENIVKNQILFNQLQIDKKFVLVQLQQLQTIDFTNLLYVASDDSNQNLVISTYDKQILLTEDICELTNCNMYNDLLKNRTYVNELISLYEVGIIQLVKNTISVMIEYNYLLEDESLTSEQIVTGISEMYKSLNYFLYIFWGLDATQYQLTQFSHYFLNQSFNTLELLTKSNQTSIIFYGIAVIILTILLKGYAFIQLHKQFLLAKESMRQIPYQFLFAKQIPKKLTYLMLKYQ